VVAAGGAARPHHTTGSLGQPGRDTESEGDGATMRGMNGRRRAP
jgi:hypothetical protein